MNINQRVMMPDLQTKNKCPLKIFQQDIYGASVQTPELA